MESDSDDSNSSRVGGLEQAHKEIKHEVLKGIQDVHQDENNNDFKNTKIHSLIAICQKFPKTTETSFVNPDVEEYIQDLKFSHHEHLVENIENIKKSESSQEELDKAVRYFAAILKIQNVQEFVDRHKEKVKRNTLKTNLLEERGMTKEEAFCSAFTLSFYTGLDDFKHQSQAIDFNNSAESEEHYSTVTHCLMKAISTLPSYWGTCVRTLEMTSREQNFYQEGSIISWNIFSSATKGEKPVKPFSERNTHFYIWSLTGRMIAEYSNFPQEDEILFPPWSTFIVVKKTSSFWGGKTYIYLRQVELGFSGKPVLWVDDHVFDEVKGNIQIREMASKKGLKQNVQLIPKRSTKDALSFLDSNYGQMLKGSTEFKIITDMARPKEEDGKYAGAILVKHLREKGFNQKVLIFTVNRPVARAAIKIYCKGNGGDCEIRTDMRDAFTFLFPK